MFSTGEAHYLRKSETVLRQWRGRSKTEGKIMKKIPLSQGKFALVDDEDYEILMQWKWSYTEGYAYRNFKIENKRKSIKMHRFLLKTPDGMETDHIDGDGINNQRKNIRIATKSQNMMNQKKTHGKSKYKGVNWHKETKRWRAEISYERKKIYLGLFQSEHEAAISYNKSALKYHGKFARLNEV